MHDQARMAVGDIGSGCSALLSKMGLFLAPTGYWRDCRQVMEITNGWMDDEVDGWPAGWLHQCSGTENWELWLIDTW